MKTCNRDENCIYKSYNKVRDRSYPEESVSAVGIQVDQNKIIKLPPIKAFS